MELLRPVHHSKTEDGKLKFSTGTTDFGERDRFVGQETYEDLRFDRELSIWLLVRCCHQILLSCRQQQPVETFDHGTGEISIYESIFTGK
jgi:hypothetical protein